MYGIFTYIWLIFMVNVGKYTIHGWYEKSFFVEVAKNINQTDVTLLAIFFRRTLRGWVENDQMFYFKNNDDGKFVGECYSSPFFGF